MTRMVGQMFKKFSRSEDGSMVVPFALWAPLFIMIMVSTIELGTMTLRHSALERALDQAVRDVRLGTGTTYSHTQLKRMICNHAAVLPECNSKLQLEMVLLHMDNWREPDATADCVNVARQATPQRNFDSGEANDVMLLRACYKYDPFSPAGYLGGAMRTDGDGYVALVTNSSFVQEPD